MYNTTICIMYINYTLINYNIRLSSIYINFISVKYKTLHTFLSSIVLIMHYNNKDFSKGL